VSADPPPPVPPPPVPPGDERLPEGVSGIDLARAALAEARAAARERARTPGKPTRRRIERRSGDTRDPQLVGDAISGLIADRGWEIPAAVGNAMERWAEIVGQDIAAHAEPLAFDEGVLAVQASSTAWATQLRLLAPEIVRRLNTELGHGTVRRIDVKAPAGPSWRKGRLRVQDGRGPRDTYG
jgi:predicted nucleic acid-binding Zn ribbon protein